MKYSRLFLVLVGVCTLLPMSAQKTYTNPVYASDSPDPSVQRAQDGMFYAYATNCQTRKSKNLVSWTNVDNVFSRPTWNDSTYIGEDGKKKTDYYSFWACDVNYTEGKYLMYYACALWGNGTRTGIGVATSDRPDKFTDKGRLFRSWEIGVHNSIDPCYVEEKDKKYLVWGSFHDIYIAELTDDGLAIKDFKKKTKIAGGRFEGVMIHKRGNYYYLFASIGSCCDGLNSTYETVVGRSNNIMGPYLNKQGNRMVNDHYTPLIKGNSRWKGTGHNSEIITDDAGQDWILYHAYDVQNESKGRVMLMDKLTWSHDGWPSVTGGTPSTTAQPAPVFYSGDGANMTYRFANMDLHRSEWLGWECTKSEDSNLASSEGSAFMPLGMASEAGSFDVHQTVTGLKDGLYELRANNLAENGGVEFYVNDLATAAHYPQDTGLTPPKIESSIASYFLRDKFPQSAYGMVVNGKLTIGIRSQAPLKEDQRFYVGNLQVIYREKNREVLTKVFESYSKVIDDVLNSKDVYYKGYSNALQEYRDNITAVEDSAAQYEMLVKICHTIDSIHQSVELYDVLRQEIANTEVVVQKATAENYISEEAKAVLAEAKDVYAKGSYSDELVQDLMNRIKDAIQKMEYGYEKGDGTAENPYIIRRPAQLDNMRNVLVKKQMIYFQLAADIDMEGYEWEQLNTSKNSYTYWINFDGKGHIIRNLKPVGEKYYPSFFGALCGECRNVGFVDAQVESQGSGAAVLCGMMGHTSFKDDAGTLQPVIVENCYFTGNVEGVGYLGSIGGNLTGSPIIVRNCYSVVDVTGVGGTTIYAGGLLGRIRSELNVEKSYAAGDVTASYAGGIIGGNQALNTPASNYNNIIAWNSSIQGKYADAFGQTGREDVLQDVYTMADMMVGESPVTEGKTHAELQQIASAWGTPWHSDPTAGNGYPILQWQYERGDYKQICGFPIEDGISVPNMDRQQSDAIFYDLSGRRVQKPTKGVYIVNGKKILF